MRMKQKTQETRASFRDKHLCPYFKDGRMSTIEYLLPDGGDARNFHTFLAKGYRRAGRIFYRNVCENCSECKPVRVETDAFKSSRSHKRTLKKNDDIGVTVIPCPFITPDKIALYEKYVASKHGDDHDDVHDIVNTVFNIHYGYTGTVEINYYLDRKLIGVGIVDEALDSHSSNYFYYDTDYLDRRLGVFSILQEIALAEKMEKKYYYLGFYIEANPKMSYKQYFRPNQILERGIWREFRKE